MHIQFTPQATEKNEAWCLRNHIWESGDRPWEFEMAWVLSAKPSPNSPTHLPVCTCNSILTFTVRQRNSQKWSFTRIIFANWEESKTFVLNMSATLLKRLTLLEQKAKFSKIRAGAKHKRSYSQKQELLCFPEQGFSGRPDDLRQNYLGLDFLKKYLTQTWPTSSDNKGGCPWSLPFLPSSQGTPIDTKILKPQDSGFLSVVPRPAASKASGSW